MHSFIHALPHSAHPSVYPGVHRHLIADRLRQQTGTALRRFVYCLASSEPLYTLQAVLRMCQQSCSRSFPTGVAIVQK